MFENNDSPELIVYWKCKEYSVLLILYILISPNYKQSNKIIMIVPNNSNLIETKCMCINMDGNFAWTQ